MCSRAKMMVFGSLPLLAGCRAPQVLPPSVTITDKGAIFLLKEEGGVRRSLLLTADGITVVRQGPDGTASYCEVASDFIGLSVPLDGLRNVTVSISKDGLQFHSEDYDEGKTHVSEAAIKLVNDKFVLDFGGGDSVELPTRVKGLGVEIDQPPDQRDDGRAKSRR